MLKNEGNRPSLCNVISLEIVIFVLTFLKFFVYCSKDKHERMPKIVVYWKYVVIIRMAITLDNKCLDFHILFFIFFGQINGDRYARFGPNQIQLSYFFLSFFTLKPAKNCIVPFTYKRLIRFPEFLHCKTRTILSKLKQTSAQAQLMFFYIKDLKITNSWETVPSKLTLKFKLWALCQSYQICTTWVSNILIGKGKEKWSKINKHEQQ